MKENNKAKLLTLGIAVVLILIICGISVVIHALNKRNSQDTSSMLQEDIMEYANASQEQNVTASDVTKKEDEYASMSYRKTQCKEVLFLLLPSLF